MNPDEVVVWTDGGARGNPGPAGFGVAVTTPDGEVLAQLAEGIGWATNNVAEYRGAIAGLEQALALGARRARVRLQMPPAQTVDPARMASLSRLADKLSEKREG